MSGKLGRSGRKATPDVVKFAHGTYRPTRDGEPGSKPAATGSPDKPTFVDANAEWLWESTVTRLTATGVAKQIDTALLRSMCELWGLYCASYSVAVKDPTDKEARCAVVGYWAKFEQAAARFGMNASDRSRLQVEEPESSGGIVARQRG